MNVVDVRQGTDAWMRLRATHDTASEAPAMMGVSRHQTRRELLRQKCLGLTPEVNAATQALFDAGHAAEAAARPFAEQILGTELFPVTATLDVDGLHLLASLDGATMLEDTIWECKLWNEDLAVAVAAGDLPAHYTVQMDQQLLVSGAERCLFMTSDGTPERTTWCWYTSSPEKFAAVIAGWKQFHLDLASFTDFDLVEAKPAGRAPETLPALRIEITGAVTASNLDAFKATALGAIRSVNRELTTDQHFADAEQSVKWCADVESRLAAAKEHALSQTASIDALFRTIDDISAEARRVRLDLEKLVKARKEQIRGEIVAEAITALRSYIEGLNTRIGRTLMPAVPADFAGAIKGKRTVESLRNAVDVELARAKIEASAIADRIQINLRTVERDGFGSLFPDLASLVLKAPDDLAAVVESRIKKHQDEQAARDAAVAPAPAPVSAAMPAPAPPAVVPITSASAPAQANEAATLKLGDICALFGPGFSMTAAFVADHLGVTHSATDKAAKLYWPSDVRRICNALQALTAQVAAGQRLAA